jgi:hypothetical protein
MRNFKRQKLGEEKKMKANAMRWARMSTIFGTKLSVLRLLGFGQRRFAPARATCIKKLAVVEPLELRTLLAARVVINEIHFDPDVKTDPVEFVELYNAGDEAADLTGWTFDDGIAFSFSPGASLKAGDYAVVARDPPAIQRKFAKASWGPFSGALSNEGERLRLVDWNNNVQDEVTYKLGFPWPTVGDPPGNSIELVNPRLDNDLGGSWRPSLEGPTPGAMNSRYADNIGPQLRQVAHQPQLPTSQDDVTISVKVTDSDGVASVAIDYQIVEPGDYIAIDDPRYSVSWTTLAMRDDGAGADQLPGDDIYTAVLPSPVQVHRRLVRYRIRATDGLGASVVGPYEDDPVPNFAYYVYDGVPAWTGSVQPGVDSAVTYSSKLLESVQTYQLITTRQAHVDSQQLPGALVPAYEGSDFLWHGTMVIDGLVYDHIGFRARGGENRYERGKNGWMFDFPRGHSLQAQDNFGREYSTTWDKLIFSHIANAAFRGEHNIVESLSYRMFDLAGVEGPETHFVHFRIVENSDESPADQYATDFQGLYLAVQQPDGRMLDAHGLPDGNLYKLEPGLDVPGTKNNQGPTQPSDSSDLIAFVQTYSDRRAAPTEQWWRENFDLDRYYSYRSIVESVRHYDITDTNQYYYHNPMTNRWSVHPWDLDLTWRANNVFGNGIDAFSVRLNRIEAFQRDYHNRLREILDLLFNHDQADQLIDETVRLVHTPNALSIVDADRAMWDYNPVLAAASSGGPGQFYQASATKDFDGMVRLLTDFVDSRTDFIYRRILTDESLIPDTPTVRYTGDPGYPINRLTFRASDFKSPTGQPFDAIQWRIAEVSDSARIDFDPRQPRKYEMEASWQSDPLTAVDYTASIPMQDLRVGATYRVRARMRDASGYWSHWSIPIQFVTGPGQGPLVEGLRITELHYHPDDPHPGDRYQDEDYEFIELQNVGSSPLDLSNVSLTGAVDFVFADDSSILQPGELGLVVADRDAFESRYGLAHRILGQYSGRLNNSGERIVLRTPAGETIQAFTYDDQDNWPSQADGDGKSLEVLNTSADYSSPANWRASRNEGGSPGSRDRIAGDVNGDGVFSSSDLVIVFQASEFEDDVDGNSTFEEGDWNGDGDFTTADLVEAFLLGTYIAAVIP